MFKYKKLTTKAKAPVRGNENDSGMDVFSAIDTTIQPWKDELIPTDLAVEVPPGYDIAVYNKSGRSTKNKLIHGAHLIDCFTGNSKITTIDGKKTIEQLKLGDVVFSFNEESEEIEKDLITAIVDTDDQEIIIFETDNGILEVTKNTYIYTKEGLKLARELVEGDELLFDAF